MVRARRCARSPAGAGGAEAARGGVSIRAGSRAPASKPQKRLTTETRRTRRTRRLGRLCRCFSCPFQLPAEVRRPGESRDPFTALRDAEEWVPALAGTPALINATGGGKVW